MGLTGLSPLFLIHLRGLRGSSQLWHLTTSKQAPCQIEVHLPSTALPPLTGQPLLALLARSPPQTPELSLARGPPRGGHSRSPLLSLQRWPFTLLLIILGLSLFAAYSPKLFLACSSRLSIPVGESLPCNCALAAARPPRSGADPRQHSPPVRQAR